MGTCWDQQLLLGLRKGKTSGACLRQERKGDNEVANNGEGSADRGAEDIEGVLYNGTASILLGLEVHPTAKKKKVMCTLSRRHIKSLHAHNNSLCTQKQFNLT